MLQAFLLRPERPNRSRQFIRASMLVKSGLGSSVSLKTLLSQLRFLRSAFELTARGRSASRPGPVGQPPGARIGRGGEMASVISKPSAPSQTRGQRNIKIVRLVPGGSLPATCHTAMPPVKKGLHTADNLLFGVLQTASRPSHRAVGRGCQRAQYPTSANAGLDELIGGVCRKCRGHSAKPPDQACGRRRSSVGSLAKPIPARGASARSAGNRSRAPTK